MTANTAPAKVPAVPGASGAPARPPRRRPASPARRPGWTPWLYLLPALVLLGGLLVYPIYQLGLISFLEYTQAQVSGGEPTTFQGFGNYATLFRDSQFWQVLLATVVFAAACVLATLFVGCALAVLLTRVRALPRLALMMAALGAWATPAITGSTVWVFLFDPDFGPVNKVLGLGDFSWTYGRWSAFALVLLEVLWCSFPFVMVTVYAGDPGDPHRGAGGGLAGRRLAVADLAVGHGTDAPADPDRRHHPVGHLGLQGLHPDLRHDQRRRHRRTEPGAQRVRVPEGVRVLAVQPRIRDRCRDAGDPAGRHAGLSAPGAAPGEEL